MKMEQATLDIGQGWEKCMPMTFQGKAKGDGATIIITEHRQKTPSLEIIDLRMRKGTTYEKINGRKVKVTIEFVD